MACFLLLAGGTQAAAQLSGSASVQSDYLYRGTSLTGGNPAVSVDLGYDDPSGLYLNGTAFAYLDGDGPAFGGGQANVGYARRLSPNLSVDAGLVHSLYRVGAERRSYDFTELYVGVTRRPISARIFYAPDYYGTESAAIYAEVDAAVEPVPDWRLSAHLGLLDYVGGDYAYAGRGVRHDWRLTAERQIGMVALRASLSDVEGSGDPYRPSPRTRLVVGATWSF
jgi:uncharacterized protein (TIGR02001 family)